MVITARFASVCPCCSQRIVPGSKVEWSKGSQARHIACATGPAGTRPARRSYGRPGTTYERGVGRVCDECGEVARPGTRCWETGCIH